MIKGYYAGHNFTFIQHFLDATPKNSKKTFAFALACCIHHVCRYKKTHHIILERKYLEIFGLDRRHIKKYLEHFSKAKLLTYNTKKGKSPTITLLLPIQYSTKRKETKNKLINYSSCKHGTNVPPTWDKRPTPHGTNVPGEKFSKKEAKEGRKRGEEAKEGRKRGKEAKEGRKRGKEAKEGRKRGGEAKEGREEERKGTKLRMEEEVAVYA